VGRFHSSTSTCRLFWINEHFVETSLGVASTRYDCRLGPELRRFRVAVDQNFGSPKKLTQETWTDIHDEPLGNGDCLRRSEKHISRTGRPDYRTSSGDRRRSPTLVSERREPVVGLRAFEILDRAPGSRETNRKNFPARSSRYSRA